MAYFVNRPRYGSYGHGRRASAVELFVPMCCTKCEEKITENMLELDGVQRVLLDAPTSRVTVTGCVDPLKALKLAKKVKKDSTFWPGGSYIGDYFTTLKPYAYDDLAYRTSSYEYSPSVNRSSYSTKPYAYDDLAYRTSRYGYSPSVYRSSYNQYTPSSGHSYTHRAVPMYNQWLTYDDIASHVITNPRYIKHVASDY